MGGAGGSGGVEAIDVSNWYLFPFCIGLYFFNWSVYQFGGIYCDFGGV